MFGDRRLHRLIAVMLFLSLVFPPDASAAVNDTVITVNSEIIGEQYSLRLTRPAGYRETTQRYPVVYVLDGEFYTDIAALAARTLMASERIPDCLVVGIESRNRSRDFTTPQDPGWSPPQPMPQAGGVDRFLDMLEKEVVPLIDRQFRTQPLRVFVGHSMGGLAVMHAFAARPSLFRAHIALESSLWWNDGAVGRAAMKAMDDHPGYVGKLYLGRLKIPREFWFPINMQVVDHFEQHRPAGLDYTYTEFAEESHSTMVFPGIYCGLRDIFADYRVVLDRALTLDSMQRKYRGLTRTYGYEVPVPQYVLRFLWEMATHEGTPEEALAAATARTRSYPWSSAAFTDLGRTQLARKQTAAARQALERAVALRPENEEAVQLLKGLP